jgi:hypothetical protein
MVKYSVSDRAYTLPLLHAAKYPSSEVCGVLLAESSSADKETIDITKAVPLFHHWTTLSPMLEVALQQVAILMHVKNEVDYRVLIPSRLAGCRLICMQRATT